MIHVHIIWDFDAAIGQINATYPYNYHEENIYKEINNVEKILAFADQYNFKFTFAITGFTAEEGIYPFHLPELIRKIYASGHEIASHTWRHEWLPIIQKKQVHKTLERSKIALETCLGEIGVVRGLVLPHNRPMSWYRKFAFSLGDRGVYPFFPGANLGVIIKVAEATGYSWVRVSYRPIYEKFIGINRNDTLERKWESTRKIITVPMNHNGFDNQAILLVKKGIEQKRDVVLSGHPLMISFPNKAESENNFIRLLEYLHSVQDQVEVVPVAKNIIFQKLLLK